MDAPVFLISPHIAMIAADEIRALEAEGVKVIVVDGVTPSRDLLVVEKAMARLGNVGMFNCLDAGKNRAARRAKRFARRTNAEGWQ
jgi:hypothetical protein